MPAPLQGIRILDLSRILAGPWATQVLADFGAEVIKIERPGSGDGTRQWGPPYLRNADGMPGSESAYYLSANRGKRSLALDISKPRGQAIARELACRCDVLVENFKVGGLARYGLGWADLEPIAPRLIYCSITAFGQDGPEANGAGYDAMIQGMGGLMSVTGVPDGEPGAGPQKVGVAVADLMCGMYAVAAVLAALHERERSGRGQFIDLSLLDTQVAWLANQSLNYLISGQPPVRQGTAHPNIVPYQAFATADGYMMLAIGNDQQFERFCALAGAADLATDSRYATNAGRVAHRSVLVAQIDSLMRQRTSAEWLQTLRVHRVPCGPINDLAQVFAEPQVMHRQLRIDLPHPTAGSVPGVRNPALFSRTPLSYRDPPPLLGQHSEDILTELLDYSATGIDELRRQGVIA